MFRRVANLVAMVLFLGQSACFQDLVSADGGSLSAISGDQQLGVTDGVLPRPLRVRVTDQDDLPVANRLVTFTVESGNGLVSPSTAMTSLNGEATTNWTLGPSVGEQRVLASVQHLPPVNFRANATFTLFDIEIRFLSPPTSQLRTAFEGAATRWRSVVTGELSNVPVSAPAGQCGVDSPTINETIDDVVILVSLNDIDGPGGSLGQAGPCFIRTSNSLPLVGQMRLDQADLNLLEQTGNLGDVILHEMGHVLGFGTLWLEKDFLDDAVEFGGDDPHFTGPLATAAFDDVGGAGYNEGEKVPVENSGGSGTTDGHWRESVLVNELMTGFLNAGQANPLSDVTVASLADLGYSVNLDATDLYVVTLPGAAASETGGIVMLNDIYRGPVFLVGPSGALRIKTSNVQR